jgi:hypothetical protein
MCCWSDTQQLPDDARTCCDIATVSPRAVSFAVGLRFIDSTVDRLGHRYKAQSNAVPSISRRQCAVQIQHKAEKQAIVRSGIFFATTGMEDMLSTLCHQNARQHLVQGSSRAEHSVCLLLKHCTFKKKAIRLLINSYIVGISK